MEKYKWLIILLNLFVFLFMINNSIIKKERILEEGQLILLELAPVDPRSLMQGDYMRLRYAISNVENVDSISKRGYYVLKLDKNGVGERIRIQENKTPLNAEEFLIEFTTNGQWRINIGAESYFFQEGKGELFEDAKYGGLKVDENGNSLLIGLYDEKRKRIE